jgi:hypothetical protein
MTGPEPPRPPHPPRPSQPDKPGRPSDPTGHDPGLALAGLDPAAWTRASTVQVLPLDYARRGADGRWRGVYTPVPIAHPPQLCDYLDSVCRSCLPAWAEDHALALFRHGQAGARVGCACPACRTSHPRIGHTMPGDDPAAPRPGALHACLPDVAGHHRHLTLASVTTPPAGPRQGHAGRRFVVVTIPGPDDCPATGRPGRAKGHVDGRIGGGRHDCRGDNTAAVPSDVLAAAAALLDVLADATATGLNSAEEVR